MTTKTQYCWSEASGMWKQATMKLSGLRALSDRDKKMRVVEAFKKKNTVRDELADFFTETSFTAVVKIYNANHWIKRLTWTLLVLGMVSWLIVQCYWLLDRYFQYPVEVKIDLKGAVNMEFPSVTFCNLNPIRVEALSDSKYALLRRYTQPPTEDSLYQSLKSSYQFAGHCESYQYECGNRQCVPLRYKCDGYNDCATLDDEEDCETWTCDSDMYRCPEGSCLPKDEVCDGISGCYSSGADEWYCGGGTGTSTTIHHLTSLLTSLTSGDTTGMTTPGWGKRRKRAIEISQKVTMQKDSRRHFYDQMMRDLNDMKAKLQNGTVSQDTYNKFVNDQRKLLGQENKRMSLNKKLEESTDDTHHRVKRSGSDSEESREQVDWEELLGNTSFNRWDQLHSSNDSQSYYMERDDEYEASMTYSYVTAAVGAEYAEQGGNLKKDFIASCKFNGYKCSPENFTYFHSYKYGNCYTFNAMGHNRDLINTFAGPSSGLRVELFINQEEYVANLAAEAGVRVSVHAKGTKPFPEDEGISVSPKSSTSIGMKQTIVDRLPAPHGLCAHEGKTVNYYEKYEDFHYTKLSCSKSCFQDIIYDSCNCLSPVYFIVENRTICNMTDPVTERCINDLMTTHLDRYHKCDTLCPPACHEVLYDVTMSEAIWPASNYEEFYQSRLGKTNSKYLLSRNIYTDFSRVQVYFKDFIFQHIQQQKAYESMNLISDLGGQLGLWLGLSAITIGEIASFLFRLGRSLPHALSKEEKKAKKEEAKSGHKVAPVTLEEMYEDIVKEDMKDIIPPAVTKPKTISYKA